ncbi:UBP-type zinc finger domain-containing protein [Cellulophaga sp. E16_2]|uniref:Zinc finger UBP-type protein n=1 Tax=Cellulophaga algicola (strain DSM 14237 / IC166 / ACAM 630) TaxID=688270 RepID=E6XD26_CELAD|nr:MULTISPECIES: UBP-type zinc finger domain-containing protein [Cellulophaga]ADV51213.1 zinc finger UBP-type protein [Cellulophaga algicola DSM 14237]MBO0593600.1 UBP-type zinc finger domain-containing protein [Cellulophaga sp. E16_2]
MSEEVCSHIASISELKLAKKQVCQECVKLGDSWVHLRTCQECGVTLCCDDSKNKHATAHFHKTDHPVISSAEYNERWLWCYKDESFVTY